MKNLYLFLILIASPLFVIGQSAGDYRSNVATGDWSDATVWETFDGVSWVPAVASPTDLDGVITIRSGHSINIDADVMIDDTFVEPTASLQLNPGINLFTPDFVFIDVLTIDGTFNNRGNFTAGILSYIQVNGSFLNFDGGTLVNTDASNMFFNAGSIYNHRNATTPGDIPGADWNATSTCTVTGYTTNATAPGNLNQTFGNFTWATASFTGATPTAFVNLGGQLTNVLGDLRITATGISAAKSLRFASTGDPGFTLSIGGSLIIQGGSTFFVSGTVSPTIMNIAGDYSQGSVNVILTTGGGDITVNVGGSFNKTGGSISRVAPGNARFHFNGGSLATQNYTTAGSAIATIINFSVENGSRLNFVGENALTGGGTFTLNAGGTIAVASANGLVTGSTLGNIRLTGSRTYQPNGNIIYNGTTQALGNEWSASGALNGVAVNLQITGGSVVTNNNIGSTSLVGILNLSSGRLNIGNANTITIQGVLTTTALGLIGGSATSSLTFSGSGAMGNLNFAPGAETLENFTIGRSGTVALGTDLTVLNNLALTSGNLNISNRTLTFSGPAITSASTGLISNATSNLMLDGSAYTGSIPFSGGGNQLNNLTLNSAAGAYQLGSAVTIVGNLNLLAGVLDHTAGLTMGTNSTIVRAGGSMTGTSAIPTAVTNFNVTYTGNGTTGIELPGTATAPNALNNLTIQAGGAIVLNKSITVNGDLILSSGSLQQNTRNITLPGAAKNINYAGGTFTPGTTGVTTVTGSITITGAGPKALGNLQVNTGASLVMPAGNIDIAGNIQLSATSTFNANNGTVTLYNGNAQTVSGGGKTFRNIIVDKTANTVTFSTATNLTGLLDIQTATTVTSSGNLTLISTASGTASIGDLSAGGSVTGSVTAQRYIAGTGRDYRDISPQVQSATVAQLIASGITITGPFTGTSFPCSGCATNGPSFYFYNESVAGVQANGYVAHPTSGSSAAAATLATGRGYNVLVRNEIGSPTMSLSGTINSGNLSLPVSYTVTAGGLAEDGWNFVGNPYPSAIDWDIISGWSKTAIQGNQISIWDPLKGSSGGYRVWNGSTGDLGDGRIAAGQGFWVKANAAPTLNITETAKTTTATTYLRDQDDRRIDFLELHITNNQGGVIEDELFVQLNDESKLEIDQHDGPKLPFIEGLSIATVSPDAYKFGINSINEIPAKLMLPVSMMNVSEGSYSFGYSTKGEFESAYVSLYDKYNGTLHDFTTGNSYGFTVRSGDKTNLSDRFVLIIGRERIVAGVEEDISVLALYPNPVVDKLTIRIATEGTPKGVVLDGTGRQVGMVQWNPGDGKAWSGEVVLLNEQAGVYFVKISTPNGNKVVKILKK